jgi:ATP-dependent exoDNAse (exonuclease V) alpha subunit
LPPGVPQPGVERSETPHYLMLKRNLIYTGVTRGKPLLVLVGQKRPGDRSQRGPD